MKQQLIHRRLTLILQIILVAGVVLAAWEQQWLTAVITIGIILVTLVPLILANRFRVFIPPEFVLFAIVFVFASVFLGEVHGYYARFWWC
jgi:uncharacterized membrane protein YjjP (DUF1212 family)